MFDRRNEAFEVREMPEGTVFTVNIAAQAMRGPRICRLCGARGHSCSKCPQRGSSSGVGKDTYGLIIRMRWTRGRRYLIVQCRDRPSLYKRGFWLCHLLENWSGLQTVEHMCDLHLVRALDLLENAILNLVVANHATVWKSTTAMYITDVEYSVNMVGYADVENGVVMVVVLMLMVKTVAGEDSVTADTVDGIVAAVDIVDVDHIVDKQIVVENVHNLCFVLVESVPEDKHVLLLWRMLWCKWSRGPGPGLPLTSDNDFPKSTLLDGLSAIDQIAS
ncbi:hypothetical protein PIB30_034279 [Stylosanthes scabra]|uniref:CCHC-type domain-containing protein n=1 Tax=Stylosanthes scabra TaxID=79078 RepID=A0ABU6YF71_9FABA|nr:hypothetical protein [Stylosanthes scabra]